MAPSTINGSASGCHLIGKEHPLIRETESASQAEKRSNGLLCCVRWPRVIPRSIETLGSGPSLESRRSEPVSEVGDTQTDADEESTEEPVESGRFIEAHLVDELLEHAGIVSVEIDPPLPVIKAD